ncbi:GAF domain-containing sensor histidine kinase [Roseomonas sp. E05]|uniref:GAF domain-containing sensor histidine kinase n=1 Tax=Roseomonas sp. E05 TaxID=3046310 RepID=UPI0024B9C43C|nr:GAF domain-containing sensor histidine kinase [Roseomonas sp. E05]MDJ0387851.1 GAF domain-containing sensor histidine kinase [Roseomonas sp. E05]
MERQADDVEAIRRIGIVPTILDTVCRLTGMGFAAVARVTDERWIACSVLDHISFGLQPGGELQLESTICHEIRQSGQPVIISDVMADDAFCRHHTPAMYGFRSYISVPIRLADGRFFGTLCAIDPEPRDLARPEVQATFRMFADLLGFHLDTSDKLALSEGKLATEVEAGELREQFIAVVGHDLRNPLASVQAGVTMLRTVTDAERARSILGQMQSSVDRMSSLIDNILDFARGRLGGGLSLDLQLVDMEPLVRQAVAELALSHSDREITLSCAGDPTLLYCDPRRIGQLLSNLLGNALTHGAADQPIEVRCRAEGGIFTLSVSNGGAEIPHAAQARLFHPFARGKAGTDREGLGLGLYIASEIAKAHGGRLAVISSPAQTRFTFSVPLVRESGP